MPSTAEYGARVEEAKARIERNRKEAVDHLDALPHLEYDEAKDSIESIRVNLNEIVFYLDFVRTVERVIRNRPQGA